jgi:hypothetical protein
MDSHDLAVDDVLSRRLHLQAYEDVVLNVTKMIVYGCDNGLELLVSFLFNAIKY